MQNTGKFAAHLGVVKSDKTSSKRSMIKYQNRLEGTISGNKICAFRKNMWSFVVRLVISSFHSSVTLEKSLTLSGLIFSSMTVSPLYLQNLEQCLAHSRYYPLTKWMTMS